VKYLFIICVLAITFSAIGQETVNHKAYSLSYSEQHEQAAWVAYTLTKKETIAQYERTDNFRPDPLILTESANDNDYKGSGYDRGHLAPAADMAWSAESMSESFFYSNMSPQDPSFNRGIWKKLEEQVRSWAVVYDSVRVITGPVLNDGLSTIGENGVSVPNYYYKVILDNRANRQQAIGFVLANEKSPWPISTFAVSVDSVEKITGLDFYTELEDSLENKLEESFCADCWDWTITKLSQQSASEAQAAQCFGKTLNGERCLVRTKSENGFCHIHQDQQPNTEKTERRSTTVRCTGTTKAGTQCKHMTYSPNSRCFQHGGD